MKGSQAMSEKQRKGTTLKGPWRSLGITSVKGAEMKKSLAPSAAPASVGAGAAAVDIDESTPPPQNKARHEEAGGSQ